MSSATDTSAADDRELPGHAGPAERKRLLRAAVDVAADRGFTQLTVDDVCSAAAVSREVFDAEFDSLEDCFAVAYDALAERVLSSLASVQPTEPWPRYLHDLLHAYLRVHDEDRSAAILFHLEAHGSPAVVTRRRQAAQESFVDAVRILHHAIRAQDPTLAPGDESIYRALFEGIVGIVSYELRTHPDEPLVDCTDSIVRFVGALALGIGPFEERFGH